MGVLLLPRQGVALAAYSRRSGVVGCLEQPLSAAITNPTIMPANLQSHASAGAPAARCPFRRLLGTPESLSEQLKSQTRPQHTQAEHHPLQQRAVTGSITRLEYASWAAQLNHIHQNLEGALDSQSQREPRLTAVFTPECRRLQAFQADLSLLDPHQECLHVCSATAESAAWIQSMSNAQPLALLGVLYVLEGSTNGGKFIAAVLRRAWGMPAGEGLRSLDPHGAATHERWQHFKTALDGLKVSQEERSAIILAAGGTFERISAIMDELCVGNPHTEAGKRFKQN